MKIHYAILLSAVVLCALCTPSYSASIKNRGLTDNLDDIVGRVVDLVASIVSTVNSLLADLDGIAARVGSNALRGLVSDAVNEAAETISVSNSTVQTLLNCVGVRNIVANVTAQVNDITNACVAQIAGDLNSTVAKVEGIKTDVQDLLNKVDEDIEQCETGLLGLLGCIGNIVFKTVPEALRTVAKSLTAVISIARDLTGDAVDTVLGQKVSQCVDKAISEIQGDVEDAFTNAIQEANQDENCVTSS